MSDIALNWIDGEWLTSASIATSHNPANGEVVGQFADGGEVEAEDAIKAARGAFRTSTWSGERIRDNGVIAAIADGLPDRADELAKLLTKEMGKPLVETRAEIE